MSQNVEIKPMPPEEIAKLRVAIEKRWGEKPWYQGGDDPMGSPGCMMRAQEILALIAAAEANTPPSPHVMGEIGERFVKDAIRSAYDQGYNDSRLPLNLPRDADSGYRGKDKSEEIAVDVLARLRRLPLLETDVSVPQSAIDWLFGEGPDANGEWFEPPAEGHRYWWRSHFRKLIAGSDPLPSPKVTSVNWSNPNDPAVKLFVQFDVEDYVDQYELRGDEGDYSPNEQEKGLLVDAIYGVISNLHEELRKIIPSSPSPSPQMTGYEEAIDAAKMARTRLMTYANGVQRGEIQGGGREFERRIWGAFSDFDQACDALAASPSPSPKMTGWQPISTAPLDKTRVIIAVPTKDRDDWIIGEASFDPEHYDGGDWWWANLDHSDYHAGPVSDCNHHAPEFWQPLPASPAATEGQA